MKIHSTGQKSLVIHRLIRIEQPCCRMSLLRFCLRQFGSLEKIADNYPKYLLTTDSFTQDRNGVKHLNVFNWLLEI